MERQSDYREEIIDGLVDCNLFDNFASHELNRAARYFNIEEVPADGAIFNEGDAGSFMGILTRGEVRVMKSDSSDNLVEVATLKKGKVFGEMAVLDGERRSATCVARNACSLLTLSRESLDKMLDDCPGIAAKVIRALAVSLSKRLRVVDFKVADHQL